MSDASLNNFSSTAPLSGSQSDTKSLFRNILALSYFDSISYLDSSLFVPRKLLRMSNLPDTIEKIMRDISVKIPSSQFCPMYLSISSSDLNELAQPQPNLYWAQQRSTI